MRAMYVISKLKSNVVQEFRNRCNIDVIVHIEIIECNNSGHPGSVLVL